MQYDIQHKMSWVNIIKMQKRKRKVYFISLSHSFKSAILPVVLI